MRGYTGDDSGMDGYRYRTSIAILNQQLDTDWRRSHTGHMMITCLMVHMGIQWDPCNQDTLGQSFRVPIIGVYLFQGLCI